MRISDWSSDVCSSDLTVAAPDDAAEAELLVQAFVGDKTQVLSRLRTATPLQVNLQVRIAEVSKTFIKNFNANLLTRDTTGGFSFGIGSGRSPGTNGAIDVSKYPTIHYPLPGGVTQKGTRSEEERLGEEVGRP